MKINWPDGLDEERFLAEFWQQKPLLIRSAFKDFENPIDPNELAGLACEEDSNARYIEHTGNNEWRLCAGPLAEDFFDDVSGNEWSLLVSDVDKLLPEFRDYLQPFRFLPDWRIDDLMISYAPAGGSVGAHIDQYDVFLLQADGTREWQIENTPRTGNPASVSNTIAILGDFIADDTWELHTGDMLYLPPGFAHHGIAKTEPCMTWSIGFRAPSVDELLPQIISYLIEDNHATTRFKDPQRKTTATPGRIDNADITAIRKMLSNALVQSDETLNRWIGRYVTEPKELLEEPDIAEDISTKSIQTYLENGGTLLINSQKRIAYSSSDNSATLFANGLVYDCDLSLAEAICDHRCVTGNDFSVSQSLELITELCRKNVLLINQ